MVPKKTPKLPFAAEAEKLQLEEAVRLLQEKGYRVTELPSKGSVTTIDDILRLFYASMALYHPDRKMHYSAGAPDKKVISALLNARQSTGISRKAAYAEVCKLISALFRYEDKLSLDSPIASIRILSSSWVVDRLLTYLNGEDKLEEDLFFDKLSSGFSTRYIASAEYVDKTTQSLDSIHERIVQHGRESKQKHSGGIPNPKGRRGGH